MLVRALICVLSGRSAGKAMIANRSLGNPTDRDETGGLWNHVCHGSRTEVRRETGGRNHRTLQRICATFLSQPGTSLYLFGSLGKVQPNPKRTRSLGQEGIPPEKRSDPRAEVSARQGQPEVGGTDRREGLRTHSTDEGGEPQGSREGRPWYPLEMVWTRPPLRPCRAEGQDGVAELIHLKRRTGP
jgi:hypothetical protein